MPYNLQIVSKDLGINFNVKYAKLDRNVRPAVQAKTPNGDPASEHTVYGGKVLKKGDTQRQWVDEKGNIYAKQELTFWFEGDQVSEVQQTKVFEIEGFQPISNYLDNYVMSKYYEIWPSNNGLKKPHDREIAEKANLFQMRKLWEHLEENKLVARGEFCPASRGFVASDGYLRPIKINGSKWGVEIGVFKEEKVFEHLQENVPVAKVAIPVAQKTKKLKMI